MARGRKGTRSQQKARKAQARLEAIGKAKARSPFLFDRKAVYHTGLTSTGRIINVDGEKLTVSLDSPEQQIEIAKASLKDISHPVFKLTYKHSWIDGNFAYYIRAWHAFGARKISLRHSYIRKDGHYTTTFPTLLIINGKKKYDYS